VKAAAAKDDKVVTVEASKARMLCYMEIIWAKSKSASETSKAIDVKANTVLLGGIPKKETLPLGLNVGSIEKIRRSRKYVFFRVKTSKMSFVVVHIFCCVDWLFQGGMSLMLCSFL
jgi:hypothetical protein